MIRLINRRLVIPRGDSGSFAVPTMGFVRSGDVAVFAIIDPLTRTNIFMKTIDPCPECVFVALSGEDTDLECGKYYWDIKIYRNPEYDDDGVLVGADEIDSYYSAYGLPVCVIKEAI